jgi:tetratricopeptide (TPR) repeat protein
MIKNSIAMNILLTSLSVTLLSCSSRYIVESYPTNSDVFVKSIVSKERRLIGKTPIKLRKDSITGDVFFIELEKEAYVPKKILIKPSDGNVVNLYIRLEPLEDHKKRLQEAKDTISSLQKDRNRERMEMEKRSTDLKTIEREVDFTDKQVSQHREMLFGSRYARGLAKYDRKKSEVIAYMLTKAEEHIKNKEFPQAENQVRESLQFDELNPYPYFMLGKIMFLKGQKIEAERLFNKATELDPYNNEITTNIVKLKQPK